MLDPLDEALRQLSAPKMPLARREQIRARARRALHQPPPRARPRLYHRYVEPTMVAAVCALQLVWLYSTLVPS